jgi:hypothetical protein
VKNGSSGFECDYCTKSSPDTPSVYVRSQPVCETLGATESCWQAVRGAFRRTVVLALSGVRFVASAALGSLLAPRAGGGIFAGLQSEMRPACHDQTQEHHAGAPAEPTHRPGRPRRYGRQRRLGFRVLRHTA